jgi:hypothetical protein
MSKLTLCILVLAFGLTLCGSVAGLAQEDQSNPAGAQENQAVTEWVKDILARQCSQAAQPANATKPPFPDSIEQLLDAWLAFSKFWRRIYYAVSIGTIFFGALAAALADGAAWYRNWKTGAAILVTVLAGVNTALMPYSQYRKFDDAFAVLNSTKISYQTNPAISLCDVGKAVLYGESIIHKSG